MDYIELIDAIKKRPKFFLREETIFELAAFLRGVSYANFIGESENDTFRIFTDEWIPKTIKNPSHDWIETVITQSANTDPFHHFFDIWSKSLSEHENS